MIIDVLVKNNINLTQVDQINDFILKLNCCNNSKRYYLYTVKNYLEENGIDSQKIVKLKQEFIPKRDQMNFDELQLVFDGCTTTELKFISHALFDTGCRLGEFIDIDWQAISKTDITIKTKKVKNSYRYVFITSKTLKILEDLKFSGFDFALLNRKRIQYLLTKLGKKINLEIPLSPHVFRRTKGSFMRLNGCSLEDIADILGHENMETTRKYYTKMNSLYLQSISEISQIKPVKAMELKELASELKLLKQKYVLLEMENNELQKQLAKLKEQHAQAN